MTDMLEAVDHLHTHGVSLPQMQNIMTYHDSQRGREWEREEANMYTQAHRLIISWLLVCLLYLSSEYVRIIWRKKKKNWNGGNQIKWLLSPERDDTTRAFSASPLGLVSHCPRLHRDIKPDNMVLQVLLGFVLPTMLPHLLQPSSAQHTNWADIFCGLKVLSLKLHTRRLRGGHANCAVAMYVAGR